MNQSIKAVTIGDMDGIGIKLLINLWKFKRNKIGKFILVTNFKIFKNYIDKNNIDLLYTKINKFSDIKEEINNNFIIYDIHANNKINNTYQSIIEAYSLVKKTSLLSYYYRQLQ